MAQFPLFDRVPQLRTDVENEIVLQILNEGEVYQTCAWIGKRSITPLHYDPRSLTNLFIQIKGWKEFKLWSPETPKGELKTGEGILKNTSELDVWREGWDEVEALKDGVEGVVRAGDGLIIPPGWWHSVRNTEDEITMSVNWWFRLKNTGTNTNTTS